MVSRRAIASLTLLFAAVHVALALAGVQFDTSPTRGFIHYMDPELLRTRLLETCYYCHIQPPLLNFLVGLGLKLPDPWSATTFQLAFTAMGYATCLAVYALQRRLGVSETIAFVLTALFMLSPAFLLFEHWLFYTLPCAFLLSMLGLLLFSILDGRRTWAMGLFFALLFVLCGIRSMYHWTYFIAVLAVGLCFARGMRRTLALSAVLPLALVLAMYAKNYVLFDAFSVSTFSGKNLWIMTVGNLDWETRRELIESGQISPLSMTNRWSSLSAYPPEYAEVDAFPDVPVLRATHKSTGGVNYNHPGFIAISEVYGRDARYVLPRYPKSFLIASLISWHHYFTPATRLFVSPENKARLGPLLTGYDRVLYGRWPEAWMPAAWAKRLGAPPHLFLAAGLVAAFAAGVWGAARGRVDRLSFGRTQRIVLLFLCFNIAYVAVLGCSLDAGETSRYRFNTDPFSAALLGVACEAAWRWCKARRARTGEA